jgi:hypothetical protein
LSPISAPTVGATWAGFQTAYGLHNIEVAGAVDRESEQCSLAAEESEDLLDDLRRATIYGPSGGTFSSSSRVDGPIFVPTDSLHDFRVDLFRRA